MPTTEFTVHSGMSPSDVMALFTDFGPDRASRWPNLTDGKYEVHDVGEGWRYQLTPAGEGTDVRVTLTRVPNSLRGRLVGALIPLAGARTLRRQFQSVLRRSETA